jgi:hypothetical protein
LLDKKGEKQKEEESTERGGRACLRDGCSDLRALFLEGRRSKGPLEEKHGRIVQNGSHSPLDRAPRSLNAGMKEDGRRRNRKQKGERRSILVV